MKWLKLSEHKEAPVHRGSLVRFSASHPFEKEVVMMVCDSHIERNRLGLITISGNKAGFNCFATFPEHVRNADGSITAGMIYNNWATWIDPEWSPDSVWISSQGLNADDLK